MGLVEGKLMNPKDINALADLPSREVLISKALAGDTVTDSRFC